MSWLKRVIFDKAMAAHLRSSQRFTKGPQSVSVWGYLWWRFVAVWPKSGRPTR